MPERSVACTGGQGMRLLIVRLLIVVAAALMLAACSKCDVPALWPHDAPAAPQSCHDGAGVK